MKFLRIVLIFMMFLSAVNIYSQNINGDTSAYKKLDTVYFKYEFQEGDELIYDVVTFDSIAINYGPPLLKERKERIKISCDSVDSNGLFYLNQQLIRFYEIEHTIDTTNVERKTHPWLGRTAYYTIDSTGKRHNYAIDDSTKATLAPGGAFHPYLFFPIERNHAITGLSWLVNSLDDIPENGFPVPLIRQTSKFQFKESIDTLGEQSTRLEYIQTGQGSMTLKNDRNDVRLTTIITSMGYITISDEKHVPVHYFSTSELKLSIHQPGKDRPIPGTQHINTNFTLVKFDRKK